MFKRTSSTNSLSDMSSHQIREADISRLSFAVELAEEFYGRFAQLYSASLSCLI